MRIQHQSWPSNAGDESIFMNSRCHLVPLLLVGYFEGNYFCFIYFSVCPHQALPFHLGTEWSATFRTWYRWICWKCDTKAFWKVDGCGRHVSFLPWALWSWHCWPWTLVFWRGGISCPCNMSTFCFLLDLNMWNFHFYWLCKQPSLFEFKENNVCSIVSMIEK